VKENSDGNDTNVGSIGNSIEEDMKYIHKTLNDMKIKDEDAFMSAVATIFRDYKRVSKENEQLRTEVNSLRKENEECKLDVQDYLKQAQENAEMYRKAQKKIQDLKAENEELKNKLNLKQFDVNIVYNDYLEKLDEYERNTIPIQRIKDIIDRIDYDIKKTKEIISKNTNIYASYRKNDYQIVRLKAMNTKSLDIKKRLQELLDGSDTDVGSIESEE
jgi:uncharacterized coiled-coil DUF342 family protein